MVTSPENVLDCCPLVHPDGPHLHLATQGTPRDADCETEYAVTLVGSRRDCDLPLNDPDVSTVHCAIVHTGDGFIVRDLCSRNGTFVNGESVRSARLRPGDTLRVAKFEIAIEFRNMPEGKQNSADGGHDSEVTRESASTLPLIIGDQDVSLRDQVITIGRRSSCDVVVDTPDVSLVHALLFAFGGKPVVCDLGSRSGTLVNGQRVQLAWLHDEDNLGIGGESLRIGCTYAPAPPAKVEPQPEVTVRNEVAAPLEGDEPPSAAKAKPAEKFTKPGAPEAKPAATPDPGFDEALLRQVAQQRAKLVEQAEELEHARTELEEQMRGLDVLRAELKEREQVLDARQQQLDAREQNLDERAAQLSATAAKTERAEHELELGKAEVEQRLIEARRLAEQLERRLRTIDDQERVLQDAWADFQTWHAEIMQRYDQARRGDGHGPDLPLDRVASEFPDAPFVADLFADGAPQNPPRRNDTMA